MPANDLIKTVADNIETLARERAKLKGGNGKRLMHFVQILSAFCRSRIAFHDIL